MLKIIIATITLIPIAFLLNPKILHQTITSYSFILATLSLSFLKQTPYIKPITNSYINLDSISAPLLTLSFWLVPLIIIASQNAITSEPMQRQRIFLATIALLQTLISLTFTASNLTLIYIIFEATLIPTLIIITR